MPPELTVKYFPKPNGFIGRRGSARSPQPDADGLHIEMVYPFSDDYPSKY